MREREVQIESWGPFGENPTLTAIGEAHGKSVAQVVLRWLIQREVVAIPKSVCKDRIDENIDVFDFELTQEEMFAIATMDTGMSLFFDHRDTEQVGRLGTARLDI
jgi:2,5-diketo-D-gluconate reductase A